MTTVGRNGRLPLISEMKASGVSCSCRGVHTVRSLALIPLCLGTGEVGREGQAIGWLAARHGRHRKPKWSGSAV